MPIIRFLSLELTWVIGFFLCVNSLHSNNEIGRNGGGGKEEKWERERRKV